MTSKLYTRAGDAGQTSLGDGSRTEKGSLRIEAIGQVDELNAMLGLVAAQGDIDDAERKLLTGLQNSLFSLGAELATPGTARLAAEHVTGLEQRIDGIDAQLPPLRNFVLPGGTQTSALCHLARTLCRRAERSLFHLAEQEQVNSQSLKYLNRLSDLLFALARQVSAREGGTETIWKAP